LYETEVIEAWSKIVRGFIAAHSAPVALREGILKDRNPAKIEATLRRENDPRHPFYGWLMRIARYF